MTSGVGGAIRGFLDRVRSGDLGSLPVVVGLVDHLRWCSRASTRSSCRAEQPRQPAVRLLDGRRHRARHRLHPDGRRDRPVGRLGERLRLRARRRALGQPGLAGGARDPRGARRRRRRSARSTRCCSTGFGMPSFVSTLAGLLAVLGLQLYILGLHRLDQPALRFAAGRISARSSSCPIRSPTLLAAVPGVVMFVAGLPDRRRAGRRPGCPRRPSAA